MPKTYEEINEKIKNGDAVVVTAEEMLNIVKEHGEEYAAKEIDVVTTGTFGMMCSSGVFLNFGHSDPPIKMEHVWLNDVHAYHGNAAVDVYLGVSRMASPRNFEYGGGHVIEDLLRGKSIHLSSTAYGTDCYPRTSLETDITLDDLNQAYMVNPRNAYQRYACAVNLSNKTIYTYMGKLLPKMGNANYSGAGALAPIYRDPDFETIGVGTHIFLCGGDGIIIAEGTQHSPKKSFSNFMVTGDLKTMSSEYFAGATLKNYGTTAFIGLGVPIPVLNSRIAKKMGVGDDQIFAEIQDYGTGRRDRPVLGNVSYAELKSGKIEVNNTEIKVSSLSSLYKARQVAAELKKRIQKGKFLLYKPVRQLSTSTVANPMRETSGVEFVKNFKKPAMTVNLDADLKTVADLVIKNNEDHIIVINEKNELEGFLTTFDITKSVAGKGSTLRDIMIPKDRVQIVKDSEPTDVAIQRMKQFNISSLPVIDEKGKVVGIITAGELIRSKERIGGMY